MIWLWEILFLIFGCPMLAIVLGTLFDKIVDKIANSKTTQNPTLTEHHRKTITFDKFLEFYKINPNKWIAVGLRSPNIEYDVEYMLDNKNIALYWKTKEDRERYYRWVVDKDIQELNKKDAEEYQLILEDIQKDVQAKMDTIEKERNAELKRIEEERKKNQTEYDRLMQEITNLARRPKCSNGEDVLQEDGLTVKKLDTLSKSNKAYVKKDYKYLLYDYDTIVMYNGKPCKYFEADCGIPYIRTEDGKILEVVFEE